MRILRMNTAVTMSRWRRMTDLTRMAGDMRTIRKNTWMMRNRGRIVRGLWRKNRKKNLIQYRQRMI